MEHPSTPQRISCAFLNVDGLKNLFNLDKPMMQYFSNLDFFGIVESWKDKLMETFPRFLTNFQPFQIPATRACSTGRASGGIILFVRKNSNWFSPCILANSANYILLSLKTASTELLFCLAYHSPDIDDEEAVNEISDVANIYGQRKPDSPFIIMGDLNA